MSRGVTIKVEGFKELDKALSELSRTTAKNVAKRGLLGALEPMAEVARQNAPRDSGDLADSITVSSRNPRGNKKQSAVEVHMGPGRHPQASLTEFGNRNHGPQPFMRPAWEQEKLATLDRIKANVWDEIEAAAKRAARKTARLAKKAGA